jgi:hypothetical protein
VLAHGTVRVAADAVAPLRQKPGPGAGEGLPASFLKHADEQSVVGLAAVLQAIDRHGLRTTPFTDWGVLAAPRFVGRMALAVAIRRYAAEGAWGISPHLIPHRSLHALSGTVSQALKVHGPNFGVGGGPTAAGECLLTAAALLGTRPLPGVWVVLTGWDPEPVPDADGKFTTPSVCTGVALALTAPRPGGKGPRLTVHAAPVTGHQEGSAGDRSGRVTAERVAAALAAEAGGAASEWHVGGGAWARLEGAAAARGLPAPHLFRRHPGRHAAARPAEAGPGREP